jgi:hypothetical protein
MIQGCLYIRLFLLGFSIMNITQSLQTERMLQNKVYITCVSLVDTKGRGTVAQIIRTAAHSAPCLYRNFPDTDAFRVRYSLRNRRKTVAGTRPHYRATALAVVHSLVFL